jgi:mono/diheme cytochrome c family protein
MCTILKKIIGILVVAGVVIFVLMQLVPYGRNHANPPVVQEPNWDSPATRALAQRACFDCHSNETVWPWYSNIAPASWLLASDTTEARGVYNFSDWHSGDVSPEMAARAVRERIMPPSRYLMLHPEARLTDAEIEQLAQGLQDSLK